MNFRLVLAGLALFGAQATLRASITYGFGTIPSGTPEDGVGISLGDESYVAGSWTEHYINDTNQNIVCVVALASTTNVCGNPGPSGAVSIPITAPTGTTPLTTAGISNYLLTDGDPDWGAPVSVDLDVTQNDTYTISFYQAASEETGEGVSAKAYDDSWLAYLLPTTDSAGVYICPQAYCSDNGGTVTDAPTGSTLAFGSLSSGAASDFMADAASSSTAWELESFTFTASATGTQVLEFVTNVFSSTDTVLGSGTTFVPPMLALADVTLTQQGPTTPEPGTWALTLLGAGFVIGAGRLRRKLSARR